MISQESMCDCKREIGNEHFWNSEKCVPTKSEFSNCHVSYECLSPMQCISNKCICPGTSYYNATGYECKEKLLNGGSCDGDRMCKDEKGLFCLAGVCSCKINQFWLSSISSCQNYYDYGEVGCSADSQCSPGLSLLCNTNLSNNNCTCPILSQANMCDCMRTSGNEFYWDGSKCAPALPFDSACFFDFECQTITKGLECNATISRCYCMNGWNHYDGICYRIFGNNGAASDRANLFSKCPAIYARSQMAILSSGGIFSFVKSLDPDMNKVNFKDSYIGMYFAHNHQCPSTGGCVNHTIVWCERWDRCSKRWQWHGGVTSFVWCTGSPVEVGADVCVRIDATSGTCFTNKACSHDKNFICEYPV
jgi:hypothetical protein